MSLVALGMALIDSVKSGDLAAVEGLLAAGADPNAVDLFGDLTALQLAHKGGHDEIVRLLLEQGALLSIDPPPDPPAPAALLAEVAGLIVGPGARLAACLGTSGAAVVGQVVTVENRRSIEAEGTIR